MTANRRRRAYAFLPDNSRSNRGNHLTAVGWPKCTMMDPPRQTNSPSNLLGNIRRRESMDTPSRGRQPIMVRFALSVNGSGA